MWPGRFCLPVTHHGMEGQKDRMEPVVKHLSDWESLGHLVWNKFLSSTTRESRTVIDLRLAVISRCVRVVRQHITCEALSWVCVGKVSVGNGFWGGGCGAIAAGHMNHSEHAGNKVHFFYPDTPSFSPSLEDMAWAPWYQSAWRQPPFFPGGGGGGARGKCFDLNGNIYHTCFFFGIRKDKRVIERRGRLHWHCAASLRRKRWKPCPVTLLMLARTALTNLD